MEFFKRKNVILFIVILLLALFSMIFVNNNYYFYKDKIIKIIKIETKETYESTNNLGFVEQYYDQVITGKIMNGKNKHQDITVVNETSSSSVITETYKVGDDLILNGNNIEGLKRDKYIVLITLLFVISIFVVGKLRGLMAIISVVINIIVFYLGLDLYFKGVNLLLLCVIESVFFTTCSLIMASGINKKTFSAFLSVIVSFFSLLIITLIVIKFTDYSGINFVGMGFLTVPIYEVFIAELLIGGLGAIMDVSVTMSSSISELVSKNKEISTKSLVKSGLEVGKDIMSTMINVLFFTYLCGGLPLFVLALRNGYTLYNYVSANFSLEITRFLVGSIGIVLSIPIALFVSIKTIRKGEVYE